MFSNAESSVEELASEIKNSKLLLEGAFNESITRDVDREELLGNIESMGFSICSEDVFSDIDMDKKDIEYYSDIDDIIMQCRKNRCLSMIDMYDFFSVLQLSREWMRVAYGLTADPRQGITSSNSSLS